MRRNLAEKTTINDNYSRRLIRGTVNATVGIDSPKRLIQTYGKHYNRVELLRIIERESKFKIAWYAIFVTFIIVFACLYPSSYLSLIELAVLMLAIDLTSRGKIIGVVITVFECFLYSYISYQSGLMGEIVKNLAIALPLNIYTIISWTINNKKIKKEQQENKYKHKESADIVIKKMPRKTLIAYIGVAALTSTVSFFILKYLLGQTTSLITGSLVLGFMMIYKILSGARYMEAWIFGIVQSGLSTLMWIVTIFSGSIVIAKLPMIAVTLACLSNQIYAYILWKALYRRVAVNGGILLNKRSVSISRVIKLRRKYKNLHWNKEIDINKNS